MKIKKTDIIFIIIIFIGVLLLAYPGFSNWWNSKHQSTVIGGYIEMVEDTSESEKNRLIEEAIKYNNALIYKGQERFNLNENEEQEYFRLLKLKNEEIFSYVEIPKFNIKMPVYHGTDQSVLQIGAGHIPGSSLPVGGKGTNAVISAHTGLPSARLFTDIEKLKMGDIFMIYTLGNTMTYRVDKKVTVLPGELDELDIDAESDFVTLQTCTPYGVNTHRLLVRGTRINNILENIYVIPDVIQCNKFIFNGFIILILILTFLALKSLFMLFNKCLKKIL
ncbi:class C sortase [Eubacteriales bacterium KG127]